jgi:hypothetical protein
MNLSEHFTYKEMISSETGERLNLDNTPPGDILANLRTTAIAMETVRALLGHPIRVLSGYRSGEVNKAVGGASGSQHMVGQAVDFVCPSFGSPYEVAMQIANSDIQYDQLISEPGWVHISFAPNPRMECLTRRKIGYITGIREA